jgi:hypothetical protein
LVVGAGPPSLLYNHVNRSFRWGRGLFDLAGLAGSAVSLLSFTGPSRLFELPTHRGFFVWRCFSHRL